MSRPADNASELAQGFASLVADGAFPAEAANDLRRWLGHSLASPSPGERRSARLGLLIQLVSNGNGEFITSNAYDRAREDSRGRGEDWPTASALSRAYGHWLSAVRAACRFWFEGGGGVVADSHAHALAPKRRYQPDEIVRALRRCRQDLDLQDFAEVWPTEWEYAEWARLSRRLARQAGTVCRLPGLFQIARAFGTYDAAVEIAQSARIAPPRS